ncbi:MAG TPA: CDC27 family protein [Bacteroidales bacterium]|nr:CDC27 family protein [Bacteroidales bacterium]
MDTGRVIQQHKRICNLISGKKVKESLDILEDMMTNTGDGNFRDELENLVMTYRNILRYTIEGVRDPERNKIYLRLLQSILILADKVKQDILSHYSGWHTYWVKQQIDRELALSGKTIVETVDDLMFKQELDEWLRLSSEFNPDPDSEISRKHKHLIKNIFDHLWITDYYGEAEDSLIAIIRDSGKFRWFESSIFVSAITLSLFRTWQPEKVIHLINLYISGGEQVSERALTGLILNLHYYNDRMSLYPEIIKKTRQLSAEPKFREHTRIIVLQTVRSRETEKLSRKLNDEILPKVANLRPRLDEKLDLENILPKDMDEGQNPDWSKIFPDSDEIVKSMEELTNLQMEGADVYMSAFANLKHFDFFRDFQNWFVPFYPDHEAVDTIYSDEVLGPGTNELAEALYKTPFICNSDKYSLLLNLKYLPTAQKSMMLKVFRMELDGLGELNSEDTATDPYRNFRSRVTQYLQDLYRFFKLSPYKKEFEDIFGGKLDLYNSEFFRMSCNTEDTEAGLADYFFSKSYYDDAVDIFLRQADKKPDNAQLYEKIGYCYQVAGLTEEALRYYRMAEMIDRKVWTIKKIALCLRRLGKFEEALEYYLQAGDTEPENIHTTIMIAHCYLDLKEYDSALKYYFGAEYKDPGNIKILRPIAWCYLAQGRLGDSEKYYERLSTEKLTPYDIINKGHLAFCKGEKKAAAGYYRQSIQTGKISRDEFLRIFSEDKPLLISNGVTEEDIPIVLDYLFYILF